MSPGVLPGTLVALHKVCEATLGGVARIACGVVPIEVWILCSVLPAPHRSLRWGRMCG